MADLVVHENIQGYNEQTQTPEPHILNKPTFGRDDSPGVLVRISRTETDELERQKERRCMQIPAGCHGDDPIFYLEYG